MNQESLYFAEGGGNIPLNNTQYQFQNLYQMQSPAETWPSSIPPPIISDISNIDNGDTPCIESPLVTPVSTAMYGTTSTCSWAHTVPSLMPWTPSKGEAVVRFSAPFHPDPCTSQTATSWELMHSPPPLLNLKRKTDLEGPEDTPQKVCITEEKMAARFRDMHISNQFIIPSNKPENISSATSVTPVNKTPTNLQQLEIMLQDSGSSDTSSKALILAPELKKLVEPEKILNTFLNKIEKPTMALVVWQPPTNKLLEKSDIEQKEPDTIQHHNNNITPQQLSEMCHQYLSSQETVLCQTLSEDVMEI